MAPDRATFDVALCQYEFGAVDSLDALWRRVEGLFERAARDRNRGNREIGDGKQRDSGAR